MNIQEIIESGIIELYVMNALPEDEAVRVEALALAHPEIRMEIEDAQTVLEKYAQAHAVVPKPSLKDDILRKIKDELPQNTTTPNDNSGGRRVPGLAGDRGVRGGAHLHLRRPRRGALARCSGRDGGDCRIRCRGCGGGPLRMDAIRRRAAGSFVGAGQRPAGSEIQSRLPRAHFRDVRAHGALGHGAPGRATGKRLHHVPAGSPR